MNDDTNLVSLVAKPYIATPRRDTKPEKIDVLLEKRMKEFLLERRRRMWREAGE